MVKRTIVCALTLVGVLVAAAAPSSAQTPAAVPQGAARPHAPTAPDREWVDPASLELWSSGRYRLAPSDIFEVVFPYVSEFNQVLTVQPDGYVMLRGAGELRVQGRSLPELRQLLVEAYAPILRDPVVTVILRDFEKPYFIAAGEVKQPGKFDLRGPITVTQALAISGGMNDNAKHTQVILFRRYSADMVEVKQIDVKKMLATRDLSEDMLIRPGDTIFVPKTLISQLKPFMSMAGLALYLNPLTW